MSKELSLKALILDYVTVINRSHTMALIQKEFGFKTKEEINMSFPGKFPEDKLDSFCGALIGKNYKNPKGEKLQEYCLSVLMDTEAVLKVTYKNVEDANNITFSDLTKFDTVVFNVKCLKGSLIKKVENLRVANALSCVILLFAKQEDQLKAFDLLRKSAEKSLAGPMTRRICFIKDIPDVSGDYCENLIHGVICSVAVYEAPLKDFNGALSNIDLVVNQVSPPNASLAFVNEGNLVIPSIHSLYACEYIGEKMALDKFSKYIKGTESEDLKNMNSDANDVSMNDVPSDREIAEFIPNACSSFVMTSRLEVTSGNSSKESDSGDDESDESKRGHGEGAVEVSLETSTIEKESQGISQEKYRQFVMMLHKCWDKSGKESVEIDVLKNFVFEQEESDPIGEDEIDQCIDKMVYESKVMIDGSILYHIK